MPSWDQVRCEPAESVELLRSPPLITQRYGLFVKGVLQGANLGLQSPVGSLPGCPSGFGWASHGLARPVNACTWGNCSGEACALAIHLRWIFRDSAIETMTRQKFKWANLIHLLDSATVFTTCFPCESDFRWLVVGLKLQPLLGFLQATFL